MLNLYVENFSVQLVPEREEALEGQFLVESAAKEILGESSVH